MVSPGELAVLGTSAPLALKILGPTADYLGDGLQRVAERRVENLGRIFDKAGEKLGDEGLERPGAVPPRVLKEILDGGSFCDDELGAEYFGGILASSKTEVSRDDRAATLAALVGHMSTYQLRTHYILYAHARPLLVGSDLNLGMSRERDEHGRIFVPFATWDVGMEFTRKEESTGLIGHCMSGLAREQLIGDHYANGTVDALQPTALGHVFPGPGIVFTISMLGMELFTHAHAVPGTPKLAFISPEEDFTIDVPIPMGGGAIKIADLPATP